MFWYWKKASQPKKSNNAIDKKWFLLNSINILFDISQNKKVNIDNRRNIDLFKFFMLFYVLSEINLLFGLVKSMYDYKIFH